MHKLYTNYRGESTILLPDLFAYLTSLMTTHASMFQAVGLNMFRGFAVIVIVWFGIKSALASASGGHHGFHFEQFAELLITIAFGYAMITYYSQPIPGFGASFYHLIIDEGTNLANQLNNGSAESLTRSQALSPVGKGSGA